MIEKKAVPLPQENELKPLPIVFQHFKDL